MKHIQKLVAGLALAAASGLSCGAELITLTQATGELLSPDARSFVFGADAGAGSVQFQIQGYRTLDGDNFWIDLLHVTLNGSEIFLGTYNTGGGGGGSNRTLTAPGSTNVLVNQAAHTIDIDLPLDLLTGANTLTVSYTSPTSFEGSDRAGPQGLGDEAWGLNSLRVTGSPFTGGVPEPSALAMVVLAGFAAGAAMRRRPR